MAERDLGSQLQDLRTRLRVVADQWADTPHQDKKLRSTKAKFSALVEECNLLARQLRAQVSPECLGRQQGGPDEGRV